MRTAGLKMTDVWAHRAQTERGVETIRADGQEAELNVLVDSVSLKHHGPSRNFRPYLHLSGELRSVRLAQPLTYGIDSLTYDVGRGEKVDAFYEFDDEQLQGLIRKGYFVEGFDVPEQVTGIEWELPSLVDTVVVAPPQALGDTDQVPVVFVRVHDIANLELDLESCGYDLVEYFEDYSGRAEVQASATISSQGLRSRSDELNSLFKGDVLVEPTTEVRAHPVAQSETGGLTDLGAELTALESELAAEQERFQAERSVVPGSPEQVYADRVAASLQEDEQRDAAVATEAAADQQPEPEVTPTATTASGDLDFDAADETDTVATLDAVFDFDPSVAESGKTLEQRKRELAARVADLDYGDDEAEDELGR